MPITPLPQFEEDLAELEAERARALEIARTVPSTVVVRYGVMRMIGEFPFKDNVRPGCGTKLVCRTHRGTELAEMLTSTCPNAGCGSSVTRKQMLEYVEASGGRQYPFSTKGAALRVATVDDLNAQARIDERRAGLTRRAREIAERLGFGGRVVEAEELLGAERVTFYYASEHRIDTHALSQELRPLVRSRVELRQVGARDEARLTADYERCGQYCCCKTFLKVLKPVSMKSAKVQKATLDPLKISGRCGRLMCCLRYEDQTYDELRKNLPHRKTPVGTPEGDGVVIDTQILTQLVLVRLDADNRQIAVPIEEIAKPGEGRASTPERGSERGPEAAPRGRRRRGRGEGKEASTDSGTGLDAGTGTASGSGSSPGSGSGAGAGADAGAGGGTRKRKRRRRRGGGGSGGAGGGAPSDARQRPRDDRPSRPSSGDAAGGGAGGGATGEKTGDTPGGAEGGGPRKKRRRRRRRRGGGEGGPGAGPQGGGNGRGDGDGDGGGGGGGASG